MTEFKWHLMLYDKPEIGRKKYLVVDFRGRLGIAKSFECDTGGYYFRMDDGGYLINEGRVVRVIEVRAWAEILPLKIVRCNAR